MINVLYVILSFFVIILLTIYLIHDIIDIISYIKNKKLKKSSSSHEDDKSSIYDESFSITKEEMNNVEEWEKKHKKKCKPKYTGAISVSQFKIYFLTTSIGVGAYCRCEYCGKEHAIRDLDE